MPSPTRYRAGSVVVAILASLAFAAVLVASTEHPAAAEGIVATGAATYSTRGVVKSFGPGRKYLMIAHDDIQGYMNAMTMSFEPRSPAQVEGLSPGDGVRFTFTAAEDGRRWIDAIAKE